MTTVRLLLVGRRQGALAAARKLEAEVFLLDTESLPRTLEGVRAHAHVDLADAEACVAEARHILDGTRPDAVVALVERAVIPAAAIREALGAPGAGVARAHLWRDKIAMKRRVREAGIPCADHRVLGRGLDPSAFARELGLPMMLKPRDSSGGRGTMLVRDPCELPAGLDEGWMIEGLVRGVELSVESLVHAGVVRFENVTEYLRPGWANVVPAALPAHTEEAVRALSRAAIAALEVRDGITHLEAFVTGEHEPRVIFGELACRPPGGSLMELVERAYGFDPWRSHLELELGRSVEPPSLATRSAGVWFLHPGPGRVVGVHGVEDARAVPGVCRVECRLAPGQLVTRRDGVGQHTGRIVAETGSRDDTVRALETAHGLIRLELATDPLAA